MPLASATATSPQQDEQQLGMNGWQSWLASPTPAAGSQSTAATLYPQSPQTASATTATGTNLTTTSTSANSTAATGMPAAIDPTILSRLQTAYADYRPGETSAPYWQDPATGLGYHARFGEPGYNGEGAQLTRAPITGYSVGNYDTATGGNMRIYDTSGKDTGQSGSLLTGPTSVNADYSLLTGTNISDPSGIVLEGNAGQGVNVAARSGEGLVMNTSPNMAAMGGAQGVTTSGAQVLGDSSSFINDPALQALDAGKQVISEPGIYTPEHPYTPDLGDPNSFINGGTGGVTPPAQTLWDQIKGLFTTPPGTTGSAFPSALPSILPPIIQQLLTPEPTPTPPPVAYTPPQPEVGAGAYTQANAQGGAAGSMAGVASTLADSARHLRLRAHDAGLVSITRPRALKVSRAMAVREIDIAQSWDAALPLMEANWRETGDSFPFAPSREFFVAMQHAQLVFALGPFTRRTCTATRL
jgi:hypothetical protein